MYTLITNDGRAFSVDRSFIDECSTLKMCTDMSDTTDCPMETIPIPNVDAVIMETIQRFFSDGVLPEAKDALPVLMAADFLGYETLLNEGAKSVAEYLKGKSKKEVEDFLDAR